MVEQRKKVFLLVFAVLVVGSVIAVAETPPDVEVDDPYNVNQDFMELQGSLESLGDFDEVYLWFEIYSPVEDTYVMISGSGRYMDSPDSVEWLIDHDDYTWAEPGEEIDYRLGVEYNFDEESFYAWSDNKVVTIPEEKPVVETLEAENIGDTYAELHGNITSIGDYGVYHAVDPFFFYREEGTNDDWVSAPLTDPLLCYEDCYFTNELESLSPETTYEYVAGVYNVEPTIVAEGETKTFTTEETTEEIVQFDMIEIMDEDVGETTIETSLFVEDLASYDEISLHVEWGEVSGEEMFPNEESVALVTEPTTETHTIEGLSPDTSYNVRWRLEYNDTTDYSTYQTVTTGFEAIDIEYIDSVDISFSQFTGQMYLGELGAYEEVDVYIYVDTDVSFSNPIIRYVGTFTEGDRNIEHTVSGLETDTTYYTRFRVDYNDNQIYTETDSFMTLERTALTPDPELPERFRDSYLRNPFPSDGEGVSQYFAKREYGNVEFVSDQTDTCEVQITIFDDEDNQKDHVSETGVCNELEIVSLKQPLIKSLNRSKGTYTAEYVAFYDDMVIDGRLAEFRYGTIWDMVAGRLGVDWELFRIIAGFMFIAMVGIWSYVITGSEKVLTTVTIPLFAVFVYMGWFPDVIVLGVMAVLAIALAIIGGRLTPSGT